MLDRTIAPPSSRIEQLDIQDVELYTLKGGIPLYIAPAKGLEVIRLEWMYPVGSRIASKFLTADYTFKMLMEGAGGLKAAEIADKLDFYAAEVSIHSGKEYSFVSLYCIQRFLPEVLPLVMTILQRPDFPEKELKTIKTRHKQNLKVSLEKTSYLAGANFRNCLFGDESPYGHMLTVEDINKVTISDLREFHKKQMQGPEALVFCGDPTPETIQIIEREMMGLSPRKWQTYGNLPTKPFQLERIVEKKKSLQSSIRLGGFTINKLHPDNVKLMVANTAFGGFFGSRLMKNIREDKGLTYGIYSNWITTFSGGYIAIGSDVNKENTKLVVDEIKKELDLMRTVPLPEEELEIVKSYMTGSMAMSFDNVFSLSDKFKDAKIDGLDLGYYRSLPSAIWEVSPEDIMEMMNRHIPQELVTVVAGGME